MDHSVIDILEELESTQGKNARIDILEVNRNNLLLKQAFFAAQDPYTVYYVNKFKMPKPLTISDTESDDAVLLAFLTGIDALLSTRMLTGNAAKDWVTGQFSKMSDLQQKWCQRILLKNLRCGVQESSINKVWPGIVKSFAVALACTLKSEFVKGEGIKLLEPVSYPVRVEPKLDGLRCIAVKQNGVVTFFTRNGNPIDTPGIAHIKTALEAAPYDNVVLDGEMLSNGTWNDTVTAMMKGNKAK